MGEYSAALETTGAALNSLIQGETVAQITAFPWPIQCTLGAIAGVSASLNPKLWPGKTHWMWIIRYRHGVVQVRFKVTKTKRNEPFYENAIRKLFWKNLPETRRRPLPRPEPVPAHVYKPAALIGSGAAALDIQPRWPRNYHNDPASLWQVDSQRRP